MGSKTLQMVALLFSLLILIFTISFQVGVVEATTRKLITKGTPIVWTPNSKSCGASPASWTNQPRQCRLPPKYVIVSTQSP